ncbi:MAG: pitrilysin family protein [Treponema sp.]|nr:pitrilysin family protein [Treponema sp.]
MPMRLKTLGFISCLALAYLQPCLAQATPVPRIEKLANGLEIVVVENHAAPFVRVDLAFKAGAIAQTESTAGDFHVLEHALLAQKQGDGSTEDGLGKLGAVDWDAETGAEYLDFNLKLPSSNLVQALQLWANMVKGSPFDQQTVEEAKARASQEAATQTGDPQAVYEAAMTKRVFSRFPWRRDPAGAPANISALTVESLNSLRSTWIVPSNAFLIVVGDVQADDVIAAAGTAFADWRAAPTPWASPLVPQPKLGVMRPTWFSIADPRVPEGLVMVEIRYRGPDLESDPKGAFVADLWAELASTLGARFDKSVNAAVPGIHGPVLVQFLSQRDGSVISVSAALDLDGKTPAYRRAEMLKEAFRGTEVMEMKIDPSYFSAEEISAAKARMITARSASLDSIDGMDAQLRFDLCSASMERFTGWEAGIQAVDREAMANLVNDWVLHNLEVVAIRINPAEAEREARALEAGGFEKADAQNSFWWQSR